MISERLLHNLVLRDKQEFNISNRRKEAIARYFGSKLVRNYLKQEAN